MAKGGKGGGLAAGIGCLVIAAAALLFAPIALWIFTLAAATGPTSLRTSVTFVGFVRATRKFSSRSLTVSPLTVTRTAPSLVVAQKVMYQAGTLVAQMATFIPGRTPMETRALAKVSTSSRNSS